MTTQTFSAHGYAFRVRSQVPEVEVAFDDLLRDMALPVGADSPPVVHDIDVETLTADSPVGPSTMLRVELDGVELHPALRAGSLVSHLLIEVNQQAVASLARWVPLHAGAVATPSGAVLLGGTSHSGKTTLTTALALAGYPFMADEVSMLDPATGLVHPYGKPVALRPASVEVFRDRVERLQRRGHHFEDDERFVPPSGLGTLASEAQPVAALVLPRFEPYAELELESIPPAEVLVTLMRLVLRPEGVGVSGFRALEQLTRHVPAVRVRYSDVHRGVAALNEWLAG